MKNEIVEKVLFGLMRNGFPQEQLETVQNTLIITLINYTVTKETTELAVYEGDINENMLKKFLISKRVGGRTDRTLQYYGNTLKFFFKKMQKSCLEITSDDIRLYLAVRETRDGVTKTTLNNELHVIRSFYAFMTAEEIIQRNPTLRIDKIKHSTKKENAFTEIEVEKIRNECINGREKALVELLFSTGCRIFEAASIKLSDLKGTSVEILGKGSKYRTVYLNAKAQLAIQQYLEERNDDNPYLFAKSTLDIGKGRHMRGVPHDKQGEWYKFPDYVDAKEPAGRDNLGTCIRKIGKRAGVENTHPHRFRRTCATFALRRGMPIEQVSKMLGHESIETTQIYLDLREEDLKNAHAKYVV
ncbi:MAG: tyrosine-type recombinase/integrase [Acetivibrio ethanolgignens]